MTYMNSTSVNQIDKRFLTDPLRLSKRHETTVKFNHDQVMSLTATLKSKFLTSFNSSSVDPIDSIRETDCKHGFFNHRLNMTLLREVNPKRNKSKRKKGKSHFKKKLDPIHEEAFSFTCTRSPRVSSRLNKALRPPVVMSPD
ncbi:hypothetical protein CDAR_392381 [Caerostris darwini]|uniref:Uncharacterized protein n=1 Tax=Caerostris darwini TaxID=1538125 RepID=A0AAV4NV63_9ARAC|nr:hypothetical protein CDAR_392381 [Caerostris darwini]